MGTVSRTCTARELHAKHGSDPSTPGYRRARGTGQGDTEEHAHTHTRVQTNKQTNKHTHTHTHTHTHLQDSDDEGLLACLDGLTEPLTQDFGSPAEEESARVLVRLAFVLFSWIQAIYYSPISAWTRTQPGPALSSFFKTEKESYYDNLIVALRDQGGCSVWGGWVHKSRQSIRYVLLDEQRAGEVRP
jgi:hypothetical protein